MDWPGLAVGIFARERPPGARRGSFLAQGSRGSSSVSLLGGRWRNPPPQAPGGVGPQGDPDVGWHALGVRRQARLSLGRDTYPHGLGAICWLAAVSDIIRAGLIVLELN